jgi:hypothetical protein
MESDLLMDYEAGKNYMIELCRNEKPGRFIAYNDILINYPGYKKVGDYRLEINGKTPKHREICYDLYKLICTDNRYYSELNDMLLNTYYQGTRILNPNMYIRYLQYLIYWITLQEEINYPRESGCAGINLAYCRFFEAIYAIRTDKYTICDVYNRCDNHGVQKPALYDIKDAPKYYHY